MGIYLYTLIPFRGRHPIYGIPILEFCPIGGNSILGGDLITPPY
jgi:hypothetical protein